MSKEKSMQTIIRFTILTMALLLFGLMPLAAVAQVNTSGSISVVVKDPSGAVVPGAEIELKDQATGITKTVKTDTEGTFQFLSLNFGKYQVKITAAGFQTAEIHDVVVESGRKADLPVVLQIGRPTETVVVEAAAIRLETTSNQVATTVSNNYIQQLPLAGRDTLNFALFMAGSTGSGATAAFNGLPNASMNITLDGVNNNSQRFKSGGNQFYEFAPTRLDAMEEITVSTTGAGADAAGGGAMNISFVTRRGSNVYHGKVFDQWANTNLNANSFMNNMRIPYTPRTNLNQHDVGGNIGGPVKIPFVPYFKDRLFFFANFEAAPRPSTATYTTTYPTQLFQQGIYTYFGSDNQNHTVNVLQLAGQNGYSAAIDPTVSKILAQINATTATGTWQPMTTTDLNHQGLQWQYRAGSNNYYPTGRIDYQIARNLAYHGTWNGQWWSIKGTPSYPGLTQVYGAYWRLSHIISNAADWTIKPNMVNSFTFGIQDNWEVFYQETNIHLWEGQGNRRICMGSCNSPIIGTLITNQTPWDRNNPVYNLKNDLDWIKGRHAIKIGGALMNTSFWEQSWGDAGVLNMTLGIASADPVGSIFSSTSMPFARSSANDTGGAAALYATLSGRISSISSSRNVDEISHQYQDFASLTQRFARTSVGLYIQDSFRVRPDLTLNYGLRWELSGALHNTNGIDATPDLANLLGPSKSLFKPGTLDGVLDPKINLTPYTFSGDKINPAPSLGFAWSPKYDKGLLGRLFSNRTVIRSSFNINYYDEGMNSVSNNISGNPGAYQSVWINPGMTGFNPGGLTLGSTLPSLSTFPTSFTFPMPQSQFYPVALTTTMPELKTPYVQNWTFGVQRELAKGTVLEVRYVGNRSVHMWHTYNMQETNIIENGFAQDFVKAQNNLTINAANGFANDFSNRGFAGEADMPILAAAFGARGSMAALSTSSGWKSSSFITNLQQGTAATMASSLAGSITYFCRMVGNNFGPCASNGYNAPGPYAINFFRPNPYASALNVLDDEGNSWYHGLQVDFRKSYSKGLDLRANYTFSKSMADMNNSGDQTATAQPRTLRDRTLDRQPIFNDRRHSFKAYWTYDLPMGPGRFFNVGNPIISRIIGGWTVSATFNASSGGIGRLSSGRNTFNTFQDGGVVLLNGLTPESLRAMAGTYSAGPNQNFYFLPKYLIGSDGRANPAYIQPSSTPGVLNQWVLLYGPWSYTTNMALIKQTRVNERLSFIIAAEASNVFNHPVFGWSLNTSVTSTSFGTTTSVAGARSVQLRGEFRW
jgi:hypothetical protein